MNQTVKSARPVRVLLIRSFFHALLFAGLFQVLAHPQQQATPSTNQATATKESEAGGKDTTGYLATIIQSRSTNTPGFEVVIRNDGSATVNISDRTTPAQPRQYQPGTIETRSLQRLLTEIGDVSKIPTGFCPKSVSFGTRTLISYGGKTSGDLQCIRQKAPAVDEAPLRASEELGRLVQQIINRLKIDKRPTWILK